MRIEPWRTDKCSPGCRIDPDDRAWNPDDSVRLPECIKENGAPDRRNLCAIRERLGDHAPEGEMPDTDKEGDGRRKDRDDEGGKGVLFGPGKDVPAQGCTGKRHRIC